MSEIERRKKISETLKKKYANGERKSWNKGKNSSEETRKKQSNTLKEKYASGDMKSWNKGKKSSETTKLKQSIGIKNNLPKTAFKKGHKPHNYNGGKYVSWSGYVMVKKSKGEYVREHRYMWEKKHGKIPAGYVIHHKNEDKQDSRIENLEMMSNKDHSKLHQNLTKNKRSKKQ